MHREAAHVQLIDNGVFERRQRRRVLVPIERPAEEQAAPVSAGRRALEMMAIGSPACAVGDSGAAGVEQYEVWVEAMPAAARAIDPPAVAKRGGQAGDKYVPVIAGAVLYSVE